MKLQKNSGENWIFQAKKIIRVIFRVKNYTFFFFFEKIYLNVYQNVLGQKFKLPEKFTRKIEIFKQILITKNF